MEALSQEMTEALTAWTFANSGHQEHRDYIGLSHASLTVEEMVQNRLRGFPNPNPGKMYKGYQMEADLVRRLKLCFSHRVQPGGEILAFEGAVRGHPDFRFDGIPCDCKSVPLDEHIPQPGRLPRRVFWQLQGYMLYMPAPQSIALYESRETGAIRAFDVFPAKGIQAEIHAKLAEAINRLANGDDRG